jgi:hypothetical protein
MSTSVKQLMTLFRSLDPRLSQVVSLTTFLSLKQRSAFIKCCQAQKVPRDRTSTLWRIVDEAPTFIVFGNSKLEQPHLYSIHDVLSEIEDIVISPALSHALLDIMRSVPLEKEEVDKAKASGWSKEISVMERQRRIKNINFRAVTNPQFFHESLLPDLIPPRPALNRYLHHLLKEWLKRETTRIHYPRSTFKMMSRDTVRQAENFTGEKWLDTGRNIWSQRDYEKLYCETGFEAEGCCEVRQKWYRSVAKPV